MYLGDEVSTKIFLGKILANQYKFYYFFAYVEIQCKDFYTINVRHVSHAL